MKLDFYKYQGTGNDFVLVDDRKQQFDINNHELVAKLCDRHFGIGADGFMLIRNCIQGTDFQMIYFNADGQESSMCGNGGRCIVAFANYLGISNQKTTFMAIDGLHEATLTDTIVSLKMNDVLTVQQGTDYFYLNTGSPHYVCYVDDIHTYNVVEKGKAIRYSKTYYPKGTNVNFISEVATDAIYVRTYERGVENETFSCGTGVTAAAIAHCLAKKQPQGIHTTRITTSGGELQVDFTFSANQFTNIYLTGATNQVFHGEITL